MSHSDLAGELQEIADLWKRARTTRSQVERAGLLGELGIQLRGRKKAAGQVNSLLERSGIRIPSEKRRALIRVARSFPDAPWRYTNLSWSHYEYLARLETPEARDYYLHEARRRHWSVAKLRKQARRRVFERRKEEAGEADHCRINWREPYLLDFLEADLPHPFREEELEEAIIRHLPEFMEELGPGFAFIGRQHRLVTHTGKSFYLDLLFYHYTCKCFVVIDLKITELSHRDLGQMDGYLRLMAPLEESAGDRPSRGLILVPRVDPSVLSPSLLEENTRIVVSTYRTGGI
jgi:predicted nuclease of restriction endonuclease-like (RecB) superfamily